MKTPKWLARLLHWLTWPARYPDSLPRPKQGVHKPPNPQLVEDLCAFMQSRRDACPQPLPGRSRPAPTRPRLGTPTDLNISERELVASVEWDDYDTGRVYGPRRLDPTTLTSSFCSHDFAYPER
jgi:hypothetical protein